LQVELTRIDPNGNFLRSAYAVESAIEYLVYDVLEANHSGWEINDGSYGEFRFDVANGTITVARNERLTSIYSHESLCRSRAVGHSYHHALSSIKKWGGSAEDFLPLHQWFDESKAITADFRHRALRHHAEGISCWNGSSVQRSPSALVGLYQCG
jgi:uncharacterized protein DUF6915/uncharacterized protein DUF6878